VLAGQLSYQHRQDERHRQSNELHLHSSNGQAEPLWRSKSTEKAEGPWRGT